MLRAIAHRGPDGQAAWQDGPIGLGHLLMRVTQEDSCDAQPLRDPHTGTALTADLRLDNREQLAAALAIQPSMLPTLSDSALLLAAYKKWGADCVEHLIGDFLFAIWDAPARKLVLARDPMGQRHVFFHHGQDFFAFATEVKSLWALPEVPRALVESGIARRLLMDNRPARGETFYEGISGIPGGTLMTVEIDGASTSRRYWQPHADPVHLGRDEAYYVRAYRAVLGEAVACRLRRVTRTPGMFFGGGFDSTAIAGLAGPVVTAKGQKLVCAASVMPEGYSGPLRHARKWVELCARKFPFIDVRYVSREDLDMFDLTPAVFLNEAMPQSTYRFVNEALCAAVAGAGVRLLIDGHGGDYTLNPRAADMIAEFLRRGRLWRFIAEWHAYGRQGGQSAFRATGRVIADLFPPVRRLWRRLRQGAREDHVDRSLNPAFLEEAKATGHVSIDAALKGRRPGSGQRLRNVLERVSSDFMSGMANPAARHGMDLTRPFHDKRVVELALAIPDDLHFKNGHERYLAKRALADIYPPEFYGRDTHNDDRAPDLLATLRRTQPQLLAEIARLETSPALARIFNFKTLRRFLTRSPDDAQAADSEQNMLHAVRLIQWARYIEWFRRDNR